MSVNKFQPHVLILPEDDANVRVANGFMLALDQRVANRFQVLEEAGGWLAVLESFNSNYANGMQRYPKRHVILLIDFDGEHAERLAAAKARIPDQVNDRVYILGARNEPEDLRPILGSYESIGQSLAKDCLEGSTKTWDNQLLRHNAAELDRLRNQVRHILFGPPHQTALI